MQIQTIIITLAAACNLAAAIPYLIDVVSGKAKPRLVSWFSWCAIMAIGAVAAFSSHQVPAAVLLSVVAVESGLVAVLGFKNGDKTLDRFDAVCLVGVLLGFVFWFVFRSSNLVIAATIATDLVASLPTLRHAWGKPHEETLVTFILFGLGAFLTLCVADVRVFTGVAYPLYDFFIELAAVFCIIASPNRQQLKNTQAMSAEAAGTNSRPHRENTSSGVVSNRFKIPYDGFSPASGFGLKRSAIPKPVIGEPTLSRTSARIGQSVKLAAAVNFPDSDNVEGTVYGKYCVSSVDKEDGKWLEDMSWNGQSLTVMLNTVMIPGTYKVRVQAKYELGNWSNESSTKLTVTPAENSRKQ